MTTEQVKTASPEELTVEAHGILGRRFERVDWDNENYARDSEAALQDLFESDKWPGSWFIECYRNVLGETWYAVMGNDGRSVVVESVAMVKERTLSLAITRAFVLAHSSLPTDPAATE